MLNAGKHGSTPRQKARGKMSKMCTLCGSTDVVPCGNNLFGEPMLMCNNCKEPGVVAKFEDCTVFQQITQSPETLAEKLVYHGVTSWDDEFYASTICNEIYKTRAEAIAATVAMLKEVAE